MQQSEKQIHVYVYLYIHINNVNARKHEYVVFFFYVYRKKTIISQEKLQRKILRDKNWEPGMVSCTFNPSILEVEAEG